MELFDLKSTPVLNVQRFTSFEEFRPTDVTGAAQNCVVLDHKEFSVSRSILSLPAACLVLQRSFSRKFNVEMGGHGCAIVVPMTDQYYIEANGRVHSHTEVALLRDRIPVSAFEPRPNTYAMISLQSVMQTRGWADYDKGSRFFIGSIQGMQRLRSVLGNITQFASDCVNPAEFAGLTDALQETLYCALDDVLVVRDAVQARPRSFDHHRRLILRLDEFAREHPTEPIYSEDLALRLGASVRTLQTAVLAVHGMTMHQYLRIKRLWLIRQQLTKGIPGMSIKVAAQSNGFWHMGEFSQLYKAAFGELASETLVRAGGRLGRR